MSPHEPPNIWLTSVELVDGEWCLCSMTEGRRRVISRHGASREAAQRAEASMNATNDRGAHLRAEQAEGDRIDG